MSKFKQGDKVTPIAKTTGCSFEDAYEWKTARKGGQNFLYVRCVPNPNDDKDFYLLSRTPDDNSLEYYMEDDLIPYNDEFNPQVGDLIRVWQTGANEINKVKRIFIAKNPNGGCYCVSSDAEKSFNNGLLFETMPWENYGPIPPKPTSISVRLNDSHTAVVTLDNIKVGCQDFPVTVVDEIKKALHTLRTEKNS